MLKRKLDQSHSTGVPEENVRNQQLKLKKPSSSKDTDEAEDTKIARASQASARSAVSSRSIQSLFKSKINEHKGNGLDEHEKTECLKEFDSRNNLKQFDRQWTRFQRENLSLDYTTLYDRKRASELLTRCEAEIVYNVGSLAQVRMFGKWIDIPRKQVAYGDPGLSYTFSGNTVPAKSWTPLLQEMRNDVSKICGYDFNFVLVNRYQDGNDYMGEHKDDEKDLCSGYPIASLSLGQQRDFIFKHQDCRGKNTKRKMDKLTIQLENGSLLMMNAPTNSFWYHCLPKRPKVLGMRLNFTFRKMVPALCKPVNFSEDTV